MQTMSSSTTTANHHPDPTAVLRSISKRSFATLATTSPTGRPHCAGVVYEVVDDALYINTLRTSRKARNIAAESAVALCIPVPRVPVGPPSTVHFQSTATLLDVDGPEISALLARGALTSLTSHGELELTDGCFVRVDLRRKLLTHGVGMPLRALIKDPLGAGGSVDLRPLLA